MHNGLGLVHPSYPDLINHDNLDFVYYSRTQHFVVAVKTTSLLVSDYMTPRPITAKGRETLTDAVALMAERGIGNLVVEKRYRPIGILTERDILAHLVRHKRIEDIPLSTMRLSQFSVVNLQDRIIDSAKLMINKKSRPLVFEGKKFVGIITATDMVRAFRRTANNPDLDKFISKRIYSVKFDESILRACKIMNDKRIGSVIVERDGKPYGIFTERDLLVNVLLNDADVHNPVGGYCTSPLVTSKSGIKGGTAARIMSKHNIKRLALTRGGKLFAMVTARDIVDAFQWSFGDES